MLEKTRSFLVFPWVSNDWKLSRTIYLSEKQAWTILTRCMRGKLPHTQQSDRKYTIHALRHTKQASMTQRNAVGTRKRCLRDEFLPQSVTTFDSKRRHDFESMTCIRVITSLRNNLSANSLCAQLCIKRSSTSSQGTDRNTLLPFIQSPHHTTFSDFYTRRSHVPTQIFTLQHEDESQNKWTGQKKLLFYKSLILSFLSSYTFPLSLPIFEHNRTPALFCKSDTDLSFGLESLFKKQRTTTPQAPPIVDRNIVPWLCIVNAGC